MTAAGHPETAPATSRLDRLTGFVPLALSVIASSTIVVMMLAICADIALRFLFNRPIYGVTDFVANGIVACVFLQLGATIRNERLIGVEFILAPLTTYRPMVAAVLNTLFFATATFLFYRMFAYLLEDFVDAYVSGEFDGAVGAYQMALWPFKLAVAIGAAVALFEVVRRMGLSLSTAIRLGRDDLGRNIVPLAIVLAFVVGAVLLFGYGGLDRVTLGIACFLGLLLLVTCGMPIAFALLAMSFIGVWLARNNIVVADNALGIAASGAIKSFEFGVVPLFVLMGLILDKADVGRDAFQVAVLALRRVRGGLGIATVAANAVFASITGSSIASAAVFSRIAVPPMLETGHTRRFAVGTVAGSSVLGMLIPPSLLLIIYGLLAEVSIGSLFIAAIVPGILLACAFSALILVLARFFPGFTGEAAPLAEYEAMSAAGIAGRLLPVVFIVFVVMGGIYGGVFAPTEAGAAGAFGALVVGLARRKLTWKVMRSLALETGYITAGLLFLIIAANLYGRMLTLTTIPMQMTEFIASLDVNLLGFMLLYLAVVVLLGMILDSVSIMLIMLPMALPVVSALGGDLIWFGIVTVIAIEIGLLTPPFGLSVFVVKGSLPPGFVSLSDIFSGAAPFVITMVLVTILLVLVPAISTVFL
ncbi:TRAP transporter large permease subunit [Amorphus sp. MBR-141]